jgi:3-hydroxymyristoyl/3-hydroxydecanoyl-(acyl carrier protein) dehydratase
MWYSLLDLKEVAPGALLAQVAVTDKSPWFSGHFPDNPILPGIAQLDMVAAVIARSRQKALIIQRLNRVKFKKIVSPGELLEIHTARTPTANLYSFRITSGPEDVCSGMMTLSEQQHHCTYTNE